MKKVPALIFSIMLVVSSLCGCGGETADAPDDQKQTASSTEEQAEVSEESQETSEEAGNSGADFLTYEDLPEEEHLRVNNDYYIAVNLPTACESYGHGVSTRRYTGFEYYYIAACADEMMPGADLEEAFLEFLNDDDVGGFRRTLKSVDKATYDEMTPEMETVTLENGREAIKFSAVVHKDDYGTLYDCPIYGYGTMCGDAPVIVCYMIADPDDFAQEEVTEEEMVHFVDEMANTVRLGEW